MTEVALTEQLDQAIEAMLRNPETPPGAGPESVGLRAIAAERAGLHLYVEDVDAVYERAMQAGATSLMPPTDQEYGDRDASISDVAGNHWYIGTHKGARYLPEDTHNLMPYLHPTGAPKMIEFLKQAFHAEQISLHQPPDAP